MRSSGWRRRSSSASPTRSCCISSASRRAACRSRSGSPPLIAKSTGRQPPVGALDITLYRDDVGPWRPRTSSRCSATRTCRWRRRPHRLPGRRRALHRPHGARRARHADGLRAAARDPAGRAGRPRPPRAADRGRLRGPHRADGAPARTSRCASRRPTARTASGSPGGGGGMSVHAAPRACAARTWSASTRCSPGGDPAHPRHRRGDARGRRSGRSRRCRRCAARPWSTSSSRRRPAPASRSRWPRSASPPTRSTSRPRISSVSKGETLLDTARNLEAMQPDFIVIRHAYAGRAAPARQDPQGVGDQRRRRRPRAPDAGAARRAHDPPAPRHARGPDRWPSSATCSTRASCAPTSCCCRAWARRCASRRRRA